MQLDIVTPEKQCNAIPGTNVTFPCEVVSVSAPTVDGIREVLPGHAPLLAVLGTGVVDITTQSGDRVQLMVSGGYMDVDRTSTTIMCDDLAVKDEVDFDSEAQTLEELKQKLQALGAVSTSDIQFKSLSVQLAKSKAKIGLDD